MAISINIILLTHEKKFTEYKIKCFPYFKFNCYKILLSLFYNYPLK